MLAAARAELAARGAAELAGFVTADGVRTLQADADALAARSFHSGGVGTAYRELPEDHWPEDHPRKTWSPYAVGAVGYDVIVSPIEGRVLRHVGLLAYDTKPGTVSSDLLREVRYGRTTPFAKPPATWPAS